MAGRPKRRTKAQLEEAARKRREAEAATAERRSREQYILSMMSQGQWLPGVSIVRLAEQWGIGQETVVAMSRRASGALRALCVMTPDFKKEVQAECLQTFRTIRSIALSRAVGQSRRDPETGQVIQTAAHPNPAGLLDVALRATRALGLYTGVEPEARRSDDDEDAAPDPFAGWSREEIEDYVSGRKDRRALPEAVGAFETIGEEVDDIRH